MTHMLEPGTDERCPMIRMPKLETRQLLPVMLLLLLPPDAWGCECDIVPQSEAFQEADVVFHGKVDRIVRLDVRTLWKSEYQFVTFSVIAGWKGNVERSSTVFTVAHPGMCDGYQFKQGVEYVVYADTHGRWKTEYQRFQTGPILEIGNLCPLRIRADVSKEVDLLGRTSGAKRQLPN